MPETLYTRNGIYRELTKRGQSIALTDVYRILSNVEPDGLVKNNAGYTLATFDEAQENDREHLLNNGQLEDPELTELIKKHKQEQITKLQLENDNKRKLLIDRKEVMQYLCEHQSIICGVMKFYLLNKIPNTLKDAASRQLCLDFYNEIVDKIQKEIIGWVEKTNAEYKVEK